MIALFRRLNALFISAVLFFVYFLVIGLARLIYVLSERKNGKPDSYWQPASGKQKTVELSTPY
ncbi:hypothetical protein KJZ67_04800 [Patescibacteria group bacterium]|nr:hypothetical protein [Patescibacteria group bacterium]